MGQSVATKLEGYWEYMVSASVPLRKIVFLHPVDE